MVDWIIEIVDWAISLSWVFYLIYYTMAKFDFFPDFLPQEIRT